MLSDDVKTNDSKRFQLKPTFVRNQEFVLRNVVEDAKSITDIYLWHIVWFLTSLINGTLNAKVLVSFQIKQKRIH